MRRALWAVCAGAGLSLTACYVTAEDLEAGAELGGSDDDVGSTDGSSTDGGSTGGSTGGTTGGSDTTSGGTEGSGDGACSGSWDTAQPFGSHPFGYAPGTILPNHLEQGALDQQVAQFYAGWKQRYLSGGCGTGRYYVDIQTADRLTVSEAHGYGMLISAYMAGHDPDAKAIFDGMYDYFRDHPSQGNSQLMAWAQNGVCENTDGATSATDGDLDIAYALLLANKQWGSGGAIDYAGEAAAILDAIDQAEVDDSGSYVRLGDWTHPSNATYYDATRTSDFMPAHFATFATFIGGRWDGVRNATYDLIATVQATYSQGSGLLPDFIQYPTSGSPSPVSPNWLEGPYDGEYYFNACRNPWRIGVDYLLNGDPRAQAAVTQMNGWVQSATGGSPGNIRAGYWLDGDALPTGNYFELAFAAPFGVAAMADPGSQAWLNNLWDTLIAADGHTYYGDSITMLSLLAMSGNWWAPEDPPCQ